MKKTFKRGISFLLIFVMVVGVISATPFTSSAANDYTINSTTSTDEYYNLISKKDWDIAPGITESEIVLNNDDGSRRQVLFIMEADLSNEYVKVINSYNGMIPQYGDYKTGVMSEQAAWAEENGYGNVVGAMNTTLSWYTGYPVDRIGEPLGFTMLDADILFDPANCGYEYGKVGFPSVLVINKDFDENGNPRPADIPKVEMPQITSAEDLDGWEDQVIPCSSGYIVKDGVNQYKSNHTDAAPRSVVGIKPDGTVVIMLNDGRQDPYSAGMSMYELAEVMLDLGCSYAVNCDGGGTSTYLSQRPGEELKVNNSPSDGAERPTTSGILFISTAPSTNEFVRAEITTDYMYYTPNSVVEFDSLAVNLVGEQVEMPSDIAWQLLDESMGTITDEGVFTSNGKIGKVTAQLIHDGKVKGEKEIQIVWPTEFAFASNAMTVPFGKEVNIELVATYGGTESYVALKDGDVKFELSESSLGIINGYSFIANDDETSEVTKGTLSATINGLTAITSISLGKGSKVIFGFESEDSANDWILKDYNVYTTSSVQNTIIENAIEIVTPENGKVHSGNSAMAVTVDYSNGLSGGWTQFRLIYEGEYFEIANAKKIGFWIWMPDEAYANEIDVCLAYIDVNGKLAKGAPVLTDIGYCMSGQDEPGWRYFTLDISAHPILYMGHHEDEVNFNRYFYLQFYNYTNQWKTDDSVVNTMSKFTYFIDDITIEYSEATEDSNAPVFGEVNLLDNNGVSTVMNGQTINYNTFSAEVNVSDFAANNATGINPTSAKAYVDGVEVDCAYSNGRISISDITVADGLHTVKFAICDNMGNLNSIIRQIVVKANSAIPTINLEPSDASKTNLPLGSVYYIDLVASEIENVQKFVVDLDLVNTFDWELDYANVADGFELSYEIDQYTNVATITVTRSNTVKLNGKQVIASIPVRVWDITFDRGERTGSELTEVYLTVKGMGGMLTCIDGKSTSFTCDSLKVATELWMNPWNGPEGFTGVVTHKHSPSLLDDKDATCKETGYTGRTYCDVCESVVDWGTVIPSSGHTYEMINGKLSCAVDGELYNGIYTDGKTYVDGVVVANGWNKDNTCYYEDGIKVVGQKLIDGNMCTFDEDGTYLPGYSFTGFYHDGKGWTYYQANFQKKGFVVVDGNTHYFDDRTGYAPIGSFTLAEDRVYKVEGEQGKVLGAWDTFTVDGVERRRYYYSLRYYKNQWLEVDGDMYYFNNEGYALIGTAAVAFAGEYLGGYEFAMDGKLITPITGPFVDYESGYMHFAENGVMARNKLVKYGDDYYFARNNYLLITWPTYISEEQANGLLPAGEYQFGEDGKLLMKNGPVADPYNSAYINFYKNGVRVYEEGLYEYNGDYYYVRSNGLLLTWGMYITKTNGLLPAGEYKFGTDGKLQMLNGPVADAYNSSYLNFYKDGVRVYEEGLYEYNGDYYYVRSNGLLLTWGMNITKTNGLLPAGEYKFGTDGKLQMLNGPVEDAYNSAYLNFYVDGVRVYEEGLYEYNGDYYYVRSNGLLLTWGMNITKTNGLLPAGEYKFGADGKLQMLNGPVEDAYNSAYLNFYVDGVRVYEEGLYEYNGDYYYVRSNGLLLTWGMNITKTNGLLPAGEYKFGEDGKLIMLNGPVADAFNAAYLTFYKDGVRVYKEGLYEYNGDYYYVRSNGLLITWETYISESKTNDLLPAGNYQFGSDGKMVQ